MEIIVIIALVLCIALGLSLSFFIRRYFLEKHKTEKEIEEEKHKSKVKCSSCQNYNTCTYEDRDIYSSLGCSNYIRQGSNPPISEAVKYLKPTDNFIKSQEDETMFL